MPFIIAGDAGDGCGRFLHIGEGHDSQAGAHPGGEAGVLDHDRAPAREVGRAPFAEPAGAARHVAMLGDAEFPFRRADVILIAGRVPGHRERIADAPAFRADPLLGGTIGAERQLEGFAAPRGEVHETLEGIGFHSEAPPAVLAGRVAAPLHDGGERAILRSRGDLPRVEHDGLAGRDPRQPVVRKGTTRFSKILAEGQERGVSQRPLARRRFRQVADLCESGIGVDQGADRRSRRPVPQGIDAREVEYHVRALAERPRAAGRRPEPAAGMGVEIGPGVASAHAPEGAGGEAETVGGIGVHHVAGRVVAGRIIVAVFHEEHVVAEREETRDVLQVMPDEPAQRSPHDVAEDRDPTHRSRGRARRRAGRARGRSASGRRCSRPPSAGPRRAPCRAGGSCRGP